MYGIQYYHAGIHAYVWVRDGDYYCVWHTSEAAERYITAQKWERRELYNRAYRHSYQVVEFPSSEVHPTELYWMD